MAFDEKSPTVSMEARLGETLPAGAIISFDYDEFQAGASEIGLSDEQVGELAIGIQDNRPVGGIGHLKKCMGMQPKGMYFIEESVLKVYCKGKDPNAKRLNNTLFHETRHYLDDLHGHYAKPEVVHQDVVEYKKGSRLAGLAGAVATIGTVVLTKDILVTSLIGGTSIAVLPTISTTYAYYKEQAEIWARSAGKSQEHRQVIQVLPEVSRT